MWIDWVIEKEVKCGDYKFAIVHNHPKATKHGYVLYHRIVMENKLQRLLTDDEVVHHINEDRFDNRPENLEVLLRKDHSKFHSLKKTNNIKLICNYCKKEFTKRKSYYKSKIKNGVKNFYCNKDCLYSYLKTRNNYTNFDEYNNGSKRRLYGKIITLKCRCCGNEFKIMKSEYNSRIKKGYKNFYCSRECSYKKGK